MAITAKTRHTPSEARIKAAQRSHN